MTTLMTEEIREELVQILQSNVRSPEVKAIKRHREETGSSLFDAKEEVIALRDEVCSKMSIERETSNSFRLKNQSRTLNILVKVLENGSIHIETGLGASLAVLPMSVGSVIVKQK